MTSIYRNAGTYEMVEGTKTAIEHHLNLADIR